MATSYDKTDLVGARPSLGTLATPGLGIIFFKISLPIEDASPEQIFNKMAGAIPQPSITQTSLTITYLEFH